MTRRAATSLQVDQLIAAIEALSYGCDCGVTDCLSCKRISEAKLVADRIKREVKS